MYLAAIVRPTVQGEPTVIRGMMRTTIGGNRHSPLPRRLRKAPGPGGGPGARGRGKDAEGAGHSGEAGATGTGKSSGVLPPLGEFDATQPGFEVFDPCTEITNAQLHEHGLVRYGEPDFVKSGHKGCSFKTVSGNTEFSITAFYKKLRVSPELLAEPREKRNDGVVLSRGEVFSDSMCRASASTTRGVITVTVSDFSADADRICHRADKLFDELK